MIRNNKLILFENGIAKDINLPKHKVVNENSIILTQDSLPTNWGISSSTTPKEYKRMTLQSLKYEYNLKGGFFRKAKIWFYQTFIYRDEATIKDIPVQNLSEFFDSIKDNITTIDKKHIGDVIDSYEKTLANAEDNHQTALAEKIKDYANVLKNELILTTSKFNKYLTEAQIVKLHEKATVHGKYKTKLCLTYIKNFAKVIPEEVTALKKEADLLKVFDNYVVLHYDYDGTAVKDTKAEAERKKDPVLFGVILNSDRLYYIGDWIDNYCDLTLDVIIKTINSKPKTLTATSIKKDIEKI